MTVFEQLINALHAAEHYNSEDQVGPAAILWTDEKRQWETLAPRLLDVLPQFLTLGEYEESKKTGPAIWMRCMLARTLPEADWPEGAVPILYLPGVSRQDMRNVESCPKALQPLMEVQFRSNFFTQENHKDWTILAFLQTKRGGLGLDVATDRATVEAIQRSLAVLAETPVAQLQGKKLEASDFDQLLVGDPIRDFLIWLNDPDAAQNQWNGERWAAFRSTFRKEYGFDPEKDGPLTGAEKLGHKSGSWRQVWERYAENPKTYKNIPQRLREASSSTMFPDPEESWPQVNESQEQELRKQLMQLDGSNAKDATGRINELEHKHGPRRGWVWAKLGEAPLACALKPLRDLADATAQSLGGSDLEGVARNYAQSGWRADAAVIEALACVEKGQNVDAVKTAIRALYLDWVEAAAELFQNRVEAEPSKLAEMAKATCVRESGICHLFADGLRYDIAIRLKERLEDEGFTVTLDWGLAAFPTVTNTAKPAVSPVADQIHGPEQDKDFCPATKVANKPLTTARFRKLLEESGCTYITKDENGDPDQSAWTEFGNLDHYGHDDQWKLARRVEEELRGLVNRIVTLADAGWSRFQIVTDHGWLLIPGGMPKADLHKDLVESKWGRCALLKSGTVSDLKTFPWYWNPEIHVATPPGIHCFKANLEYDHGGLSPQECVIPYLTVATSASKRSTVTITELKWLGMRLKGSAEGANDQFKADIRTKANDPETSKLAGQEPVHLKDNGAISLIVPDDKQEGTAAFLVILDPSGQVVAKKPVTIGE